MNANGKRCLRLARSSNAWRRSDYQGRTNAGCEQARDQFGFTTDLSPRFDVSRLASAAPSQLQALLFWSKHLSDGHMDDAAGYHLARLSANPLGAAARHRNLRGADRFVC